MQCTAYAMMMSALLLASSPSSARRSGVDLSTREITPLLSVPREVGSGIGGARRIVAQN